MIPLSILDLTPIKQGGNAAATFRETLELARHAEALGYHRYWLVEHHNTPSVAGAPPPAGVGPFAAGPPTPPGGGGGRMPPEPTPVKGGRRFGAPTAPHPRPLWLGGGGGGAHHPP